MLNPEIGFTSDVIKDNSRFVGRTELVRNCIHALNDSLGLVAVYGNRGVGKSSLLRQVQNIALGDYALAKKASLIHEVPKKPRYCAISNFSFNASHPCLWLYLSYSDSQQLQPSRGDVQ